MPSRAIWSTSKRPEGLWRRPDRASASGLRLRGGSTAGIPRVFGTASRAGSCGSSNSVHFNFGTLSKHGFTVVELVTCIAILSILAVLVGQAGAYYREKARSIQCVANLRGIGTALQSFAAENESRLPSLNEDNVEIGAVEGAGALDIRFELSRYDGAIWSVVCPSDPRKRYDPDPHNPTYVSYIYLYPNGLDLGRMSGPGCIVIDSGCWHGTKDLRTSNYLYSDNHVAPSK